MDRGATSLQGNNQALKRGLEGLMVPHNEKAVRGDYDILEVAFHITNFGGFLRRSDKVRVCSPEVRALQLGTLPGSTTSEGHLGRALEDVANREAANDRTFEFNNEFADLATRVQTFLWVSAGIIGG